MTIFEFLVAFAAILAGLGATRLLHALPYVFNKDRSFWLHQLIFLYTIINAIGAWWATWSMSKVERWDLLKFASYILYVVIRASLRYPLYVFSNTTLPHHVVWQNLFPELLTKFKKIFVPYELGT